MTRSKHFEHAYIILSTMTKIKLTRKKGKKKLFTIECYMPSSEPKNQSVCKPHTTMFKNEKFMFPPQKDLVLSMSYQFVVCVCVCVCVCSCPPFMRGATVKHALTSTSSPPNDVPSIPWSPVVLPLWTPWGAC
jgi:hypothetical protein